MKKPEWFFRGVPVYESDKMRHDQIMFVNLDNLKFPDPDDERDWLADAHVSPLSVHVRALGLAHMRSKPRSLLDPHWVSWWLAKRALGRVRRIVDLDANTPH